MAYVNFTIDEIWNFWSAVSNVGSAIDNDVGAFASAVEAACTKYQSAIDVLNESYSAMDTDAREIGFVISDNKHAIEELKRRRDAAKYIMDRSTEETRAKAKSAYHEAQQAVEDAYRLNDDLDNMRDRLYRRMDEILQTIKSYENAISTLRSNAKELERMADAAKSAVNRVQDAANDAHKYAQEIVDNLKTDGVSTYYSSVRVRLLDHEVLLNVAEALADIAKKLNDRSNGMEEANFYLESNMRDRITRAAIAKAREIENETSSCVGTFASMAKKTMRAYEYVIDYLNLRMSYR